VTLNDAFKLDTIEQISVRDGDAILKGLESLGGANKCGHGMTAFNGLPDDLKSRAPCGT
jgi:hypothetical protein